MSGASRRWPGPAALALVGALAVLAAPARAGLVAGQPLDGPSSDLVGLGGAALAADATGAVAYLRLDAGVPHVFAVLLAGGVWGPPARIDAPLAAPAARPVVAAAAGGRVAVAFLSGGALYASVRPAGARAFAPAQPIAPVAGDPSLGMGLSGTGYLVYATPAGEVRAARLDRTQTSFAGLPDPLDARPGGAPGSGPTKRPRVAVAADATGLAVWGADGADGLTHVLARRLYGFHVGSVTNDAGLGQLGGQPGGSADMPEVGIQDDSSYAWIAFRQAFAATERAVVRPLVGSALGPAQTVDGPGGAGGASGPSLAIDGFGDGLAATQQTGSDAVIGSAIGTGGFGPGQAINAMTAGAAPPPAAAVTHAGQGLVAYATATGTLEARLFDRGAPAAEAPISRAELGPVYAPGGLSVAADRRGDAVVAFLQEDGAARRLAVAAAADPPGPLAGLTTDRPVRIARPLLRWTAARPGFSPVTYTVRLDGKVIAVTPATSLRVPVALPDGVHRWQVIAADRLGQQTPAAERALRVAAGPPPAVTLDVAGRRRVGSALTFTVGVRAPAGAGRVLIDYGDRTRAAGGRVRHRYRRAGRFTVRVTVTDRAGHQTIVQRVLAIV